jgi:hypothetical protein
VFFLPRLSYFIVCVCVCAQNQKLLTPRLCLSKYRTHEKKQALGDLLDVGFKRRRAGDVSFTAAAYDAFNKIRGVGWRCYHDARPDAPPQAFDSWCVRACLSCACVLVLRPPRRPPTRARARVVFVALSHTATAGVAREADCAFLERKNNNHNRNHTQTQTQNPKQKKARRRRRRHGL